jgi:hypothetical protein
VEVDDFPEGEVDRVGPQLAAQNLLVYHGK